MPLLNLPSMGPPPFDGGNNALRVKQEGDDDPSMGPPPFDGGNAVGGAGAKHCAWRAFNGATAFRRWKQRFPAHPSGQRQPCLQWGHRLSTVETTRIWASPADSRPAFNGATAFRRWKRKGCQDLLHWLGKPSMGPPPFDGGNYPWVPGPYINTPAFNGATAFRRWKPFEVEATWRIRQAFNGATAFRRWKPPSVRLIISQVVKTFNGATAFRRWKPAPPS